jgi:hypothetical protein
LPHLISSLTQGELKIVSDGSHKHGIGAAGIILETNDRLGKMVFLAAAPGGKEEASAFRSELTGILASFLMVSKICKYFDLKKGTATLGCNGLSAIQQAQQESLAISPDISCFDIISAI